MHRLIVIRRQIEPPLLAACEDTWDELQREVSRAGGRAWRFRSAQTAGQYAEFIEWSGEVPLLDRPAIRASLERLQALAPGSTEEWEEATTQS
jgi:hypothetical protein